MKASQRLVDRISIAVWAVTITLTAGMVIGLPGEGDTIAIGALVVRLPFAGKALIPLLLALLAGSGAEVVIRAHPVGMAGRLRLSVRLWALPVAVTLIAALTLPQMPSRLYMGIGLLLFALLLSGVLVALFFSLDTGATGYRRARAVLNLVVYGVALLLFLLVPAEWRYLSRGFVLGAIAALLTAEVLRGTQALGRIVALHALVVGAVVAQMAWVLPWIGQSRLSTGLLLLLLFYLFVGLTLQGVTDRLTRRIALEYGLVAAGGLALIMLFVP